MYIHLLQSRSVDYSILAESIGYIMSQSLVHSTSHAVPGYVFNGDSAILPTTTPELTALVHRLLAKIAVLEETTPISRRVSTGRRRRPPLQPSNSRRSCNNDGLWTLYTAGGARPTNPGPFGAGMVLVNPSGMLVWESSVWLGRGTKDSAEYEAVAIGVAHVVKMFGRILGGPLLIRSDSQLVLNCLTGTQKCESPTLLPIYARAMKAISELPHGFKTECVRGHDGDFNNGPGRADKLAAQGCDGESIAKRHADV